MATYRAPLRDMSFVLRELAGIGEIAALPGFEGTLDPLNASGDRAGRTCNDGAVTAPPGAGGIAAEIAAFAQTLAGGDPDVAAINVQLERGVAALTVTTGALGASAPRRFPPRTSPRIILKRRP